MNYDKKYFMNYVVDVMAEMDARGIYYQDKYHTEICDFCMEFDEVNYPEHNDRYLKQCYYNLQEKYDRGIIGEDEWLKIVQFGKLESARRLLNVIL